MIFVTVGTQLPFDRLVATVDRWAALHPEREVFAQVGPTDCPPQHIGYRESMKPAECRRLMEAAEALVAHAGMGTVLSALELGKPLLIFPRLAALGEHRNDHQLATAHRLAELRQVRVAFDEVQLAEGLDELAATAPRNRIGPYASGEIVSALRAFIEGRPLPAGRPEMSV